ncbi:hypothetical protein [Glaciecola sp. 1036]|uniref:hypothetical protein n=1 Tax=Alteromonadaceae TaxID=72275 RepID=UPI003CFC98FE
MNKAQQAYFFAMSEIIHSEDLLKQISNADKVSDKLSYSEIAQYAVSRMPSASANVQTMINSNVNYRRIYKSIVEKICRFYSPKQVAASSSTQIFERKTSDFQLALSVNENSVKQDVTVTLALHRSDDKVASEASLHCFYQELAMPLHLTKNRQGVFEAKISSHDAIFSALGDAECEIYIR